MKPSGYNVEQVTDLNKLNREELLEVFSELLARLKIEVWVNTTSDYTQIILTDSDNAVR